MMRNMLINAIVKTAARNKGIDKSREAATKCLRDNADRISKNAYSIYSAAIATAKTEYEFECIISGIENDAERFRYTASPVKYEEDVLMNMIGQIRNELNDCVTIYCSDKMSAEIVAVKTELEDIWWAIVQHNNSIEYSVAKNRLTAIQRSIADIECRALLDGLTQVR